MPVNIYDTPADAQFINTYERMPVDQIMQAGIASQDRWDRGEAAEDALEAALDIDANQWRTPEKREAVGKFKDRINALIEEVGGEYHKALPGLERLYNDLEEELKEGRLGGLEADYRAREAQSAKLQKMVDDELMTDRKMQDIMAMTDFNARQTGKLTKDEYGTWTENQYQGYSPAEQLDLFEETREIAEKIPTMSNEELGAWFEGNGLPVMVDKDGNYIAGRGTGLPRGLVEAIDVTLKGKGGADHISLILQTIAAHDPRFKNIIEEETLLRMSKLDQLEKIMPGAKETHLKGLASNLSAEQQVAIQKSLEEAGITDKNSEEYKNALLNATLRDIIADEIMIAPIAQASAIYGTTAKTYDRNVRTIPESGAGTTGGKDIPAGYGTVVEQGATMAYSPSSLGDNAEEVEETIAERRKENAKLPVNQQLAAEEQLQKEINISTRKRDSLPEDVKKVLDDKPAAPEFLNDDQKEFANQISSNSMFSTNSVRDWMIPDEIKVPRTDIIVYPEKWMFKKLAEEIVDDPEYYNKTPEAVKQVTKEFTGSGLISSVLSGMADFADIGEGGKWPGMPATGEERDKRVAEVLKYLNDKYDWEQTGGFNALDEQEEVLSSENVPIEESRMHSLNTEATKALQPTFNQMTKRILGNLGGYQIVNAGDFRDNIAGGTLQDIDDKYTAKFKADNVKVIGFFGPTEVTPNGIMKLQIAMDEDYNKGEFSSGFATVYVTPTVPPNDEFHNLYTELIKNLDVGPEWIEALRGQQNITTNFNLKEKFGLENDIITEYAKGTKDNYTVKINEDPVSIAEALDLFKSSRTGTYEVPIIGALSTQLLNGLADSGTTEEDLNVINDALKTKGIQGLQSLDKKLQEKVNKALNNTPYIFDNKGVIYDNLHRLDQLGTEEQDASISAARPSIIQNRTTAGGYARTNNNPGNITDVTFKPDSVLGKDTIGHAVFATPEAGYAALQDKITWWRGGNSPVAEYQPTSTLAEMSGKYAESPDDLTNLLGFLNKLVEEGDEIVGTDKLGDIIDRVGVEGFANAIAAKEDDKKYAALIKAKIIKKDLYV